jgi:hypothetical protein
MRVLDFSFPLCHVANMMFNLLSVIFIKIFSLLFCFWSWFHLYTREVFHALLFGFPYQTLNFVDLQKKNMCCVVVFLSIACNFFSSIIQVTFIFQQLWLRSSSIWQFSYYTSLADAYIPLSG